MDAVNRTPTDDLALGHPFWGECDCDDEDEHQRRVAEVAPYTKEIERLRRYETVAQKALAKATTWHEMFEGRTRARDQGGKLIPVRDLIKAEAFVSEVAAHYARLEKDRADEAEAEVERLRPITEAARHLTASAGFRPDVESPFGTEVVVVLRDRFDALGEALDARS